jgi:hypothetical protein
MVFRGLHCGNGRARDPLFADAQVHPGAIGQLLARPFEHALQNLFGAAELLLLEVFQGLFVEFQLLLLGGRVGIGSRRTDFSSLMLTLF